MSTRSRFAAGVLFLVAAMATQAHADESNDVIWKRANEAYLKGDFKAAIDAYELVLAAGVNHEDLHYNLGNAYIQADRLGPAIYHYEMALAHDPTHGVCASLIQRQVQPMCPDDADRIPVRGYPLRDNIGLCSFRRCATDCECPTGLLCLHTEDPPGTPDLRSDRYCQYATSAQPTGVACR
mgnify:CR=1 FL=1